MKKIVISFDFSEVKYGTNLSQIARVIDNESCALGFECEFVGNFIDRTASCRFELIDKTLKGFTYGIALEVLTMVNRVFEDNHTPSCVTSIVCDL